MKTSNDLTTKSGFDLWVIPRLILFVALSGAVSSPLRIFEESVIEGMTQAPAFVTVPFIIYGVIAKLAMGFGYVLFGHKLPVKNTVLRGFAYMMLICIGSYLPNILGMAGGDGELIAASLSAGIVAVDVLSYVIDGLILGVLMKKYAILSNEPTGRKGGAAFWLICAANAVVFALLNLAADIAAGACDSSWRLSSILQVSPQCETKFYIVFIVFMFIAGLLLPLWYRFCIPGTASLSATAIFSVKLAAVVWLPNVLIMAFFGTPVALTLAYGAAYVVMFAVSGLLYSVVGKADSYPRSHLSCDAHRQPETLVSE